MPVDQSIFSVDRIIPAPADPAQWEAWRAWLHRWRAETLERIGYDDSLYRRPDLAWTAGCYCCGFAMIGDELLWDQQDGMYTPGTFLEHGRREFGGYDAVVLWHAYPNLGFDNRNQWDYFRDLPGGIRGLARLIDELHAAGVRAFVAYNPWDTGTRREARADEDMLAELVGQLDADGIFLDTMRQGAANLRAKLDATKPGVALEVEGMPPLEQLHDHHLSWAQWFHDREVPGVLRNKWLERRHMQHAIRRWDRDHSAELHSAWLNGSGVMVWENVFGSWNGWNARDRSLLRHMLPLQRRFSRLFSAGNWTPLVQTLASGTYASLWESPGTRLWTLVNRAEEPVAGPLLKVPALEGQRYFDLLGGVEIQPTLCADALELGERLGPRGTGALLALDSDTLDDGLFHFLAEQATRHAVASDETTFPARVAVRRPQAPSMTYSLDALPPRMLPIEGGAVELQVEYRTRECGLYSEPPFVDVWRPWHPELHGAASLRRSVTLSPYAIDGAEVTNAEFRLFVESSGYRPRHPERFLDHWIDGLPQAGAENHPVVWIDLDDARAYCRWAGKRLPSEDEWQYAVEYCGVGYGGRRVWNWTASEHSDGRIRWCILKGGADYAADGSEWYADGGPHSPRWSAKFLLMWSGLNRCASIGFRCAADL